MSEKIGLSKGTRELVQHDVAQAEFMSQEELKRVGGQRAVDEFCSSLDDSQAQIVIAMRRKAYADGARSTAETARIIDPTD